MNPYPTPERRTRHVHALVQDALLTMTTAGREAADAHFPPELAREMEAIAERILALAASVSALRMQAATEADCGC